MVTDGNQIYCGDHFVMYRNLESVYAPGTNAVLQVSYTLIEKKKKKNHNGRTERRKLEKFWTSLSGPVIKNLPASAIPSPRRFHMPWGNYAPALQLLKATCPRACAQQQGKPAHHNWRNPERSNEDPVQPEMNK